MVRSQLLPTLRSRTRALCVTALAASLVLAACGGDEEGGDADPSDESTADETTVTQRWPFTGQPVDGELPKRRGLVVKIENTGGPGSQVGLGAADLVVEELVEGGLTRLAAFYHSSLPSEVGPVRSLRATDVGIVKPTRGVLVATGGHQSALTRMREANVDLVAEGGPGYSRVSDRAAPYNVFWNLKQLRKSELKGEPPPPYLPWGKAGNLAQGKPAQQVTVRFSAGSATEWSWGGQRWERPDVDTGNGDDFQPDNVLALRVNVTDAGYTDAAGNPVPESSLSGQGKATLFRQGKAHAGSWSKSGEGAELQLERPNGDPLPVPPGRTWIELVPKGDGAVEFGS